MKLIYISTIAIALSLATFACSGDEEGKDGTSNTTINNTTNNQVNNSVSESECEQACATRAEECVPGGDQMALCTPYCAAGPTQADLNCLNGTPCQELADAVLEGEVPCIGESNGGDTDDCSGYPRCEGNAIVTCELEDGVRVTESSHCGEFETCSNAECQTEACIPINEKCTGDGATNNCCDDRTSCFGNANQAGDKLCCIVSNDPCEESEECCGNDQPTPWECIDGTCRAF